MASLERERGTLRARLMELEQTVAEGEACLRDAEAEDKTARRLRRALKAEASGRLAAGSHRRGSQRGGLASARGVGARAEAGTGGNKRKRRRLATTTTCHPRSGPGR